MVTEAICQGPTRDRRHTQLGYCREVAEGSVDRCGQVKRTKSFSSTHRLLTVGSVFSPGLKRTAGKKPVWEPGAGRAPGEEARQEEPRRVASAAYTAAPKLKTLE